MSHLAPVPGLARAALAAVALGLAAAGPATAAPPWPVTPAHDPFYASAPGFEDAAPGTVLRARRTTALAYGLPVALAGVQAWRVQFRSTGTRGEPITAVTTVLRPRWALRRRGLISYQTAMDAVAPKCRPSYALRTGTEYEAGLMALALARGATLSVPDFEGPRDAWGAGPISARITLDGIRAALRFGPAGLRPSTPVGLFGYSGGGLASGWAAEQQDVYAPELNLRGVAMGGVPANLELVLRAADGGPFSSIPIIAAAGVAREYPEVGLDTWLSDRGRGLMRHVGEMCREQLARWPFERLSRLSTRGHPLDLPEVRAVMAINSLGQRVPAAPVYNYHSRLDQLTPVRGADELVARYCAGGGVVEKVRSSAGEHLLYAVLGAPGGLAFLERMLAGRGARSSCPAAGAGEPRSETPRRIRE